MFWGYGMVLVFWGFMMQLSWAIPLPIIWCLLHRENREENRIRHGLPCQLFWTPKTLASMANGKGLYESQSEASQGPRNPLPWIFNVFSAQCRVLELACISMWTLGTCCLSPCSLSSYSGKWIQFHSAVGKIKQCGNVCCILLVCACMHFYFVTDYNVHVKMVCILPYSALEPKPTYPPPLIQANMPFHVVYENASYV